MKSNENTENSNCRIITSTLTLLITDISIGNFAITCISTYKLKCNIMDDDVINRWSQRSSSITINSQSNTLAVPRLLKDTVSFDTAFYYALQ